MVPGAVVGVDAVDGQDAAGVAVRPSRSIRYAWVRRDSVKMTACWGAPSSASFSKPFFRAVSRAWPLAFSVIDAASSAVRLQLDRSRTGRRRVWTLSVRCRGRFLGLVVGVLVVPLVGPARRWSRSRRGLRMVGDGRRVSPRAAWRGLPGSRRWRTWMRPAACAGRASSASAGPAGGHSAIRAGGIRRPGRRAAVPPSVGVKSWVKGMRSVNWTNSVTCLPEGPLADRSGGVRGGPRVAAPRRDRFLYRALNASISPKMCSSSTLTSPYSSSRSFCKRRGGQEHQRTAPDGLLDGVGDLVLGLVDVAEPVRLVDDHEVPRDDGDLGRLRGGEVVGRDDDAVARLQCATCPPSWPR